ASPYYNAALSVTEKGIMSGTQVGGVTYFYPEQTVSRGDFLVMAMKAAGILNVSSADKTVFCDDADIPSHTKGYVATAYELGYINGTYRDGELCFLPDEPITRAEAAVIVCNIVDVATPTVAPSFEDIEDVPTFAATAISSLNYMGALRVENGNISANETLRRGEAAELLSLIISSENK
ncbi:MAG: S-layer homology domain-containing protein, partial [Clostridia bacterium]|nr:S-layer homology domain-containing protein [Clostridia bacterium]